MARTPKNTIKVRRTPKLGERVVITGDVLRVLGEELLILAPAGQKLRIAADQIEDGGELRGGDQVRLHGTVTRVGEGVLDDSRQISMMVDGYAQARVTVPFRDVEPAV